MGILRTGMKCECPGRAGAFRWATNYPEPARSGAEVQMCYPAAPGEFQPAALALAEL